MRRLSQLCSHNGDLYGLDTDGKAWIFDDFNGWIQIAPLPLETDDDIAEREEAAEGEYVPPKGLTREEKDRWDF